MDPHRSLTHSLARRENINPQDLLRKSSFCVCVCVCVCVRFPQTLKKNPQRYINKYV